jgi:hypothetical protein
MKNSKKLTPIYMVHVCITGLYKETRVQMLRICANYFVRMIKASVYGHQIKLETYFLRENIILSGNLILKI